VLDEPAQSTLWLETEVPERMFHPDSGSSPAVLLLHPAAQWIADYYLVTSNEPVLLDGEPTGDIRVTMPAASDEWLVRLVLSLGGAAVIEDRPDLADEVVARAEQALAGYSDAAGGRTAHYLTAQ